MTIKIFDGKSARGDFQEALSDAVQKAVKSTSVPDQLVAWKLRNTKGESGGLAGLNNMIVTIEASFSTDKGR